MKKMFIVVMAGFVILAGTASHQAQADLAKQKIDVKYFTLKTPTIVELQETEGSVSALDAAPAPATPDLSGGVSSDIDGMQVIFDQIVNMGKQIWNVVESNRAVVNVETDSANALPLGVSDWQGMQGWKTPKVKVFHVSYENLYGINTVDFTYRVMFTPGGNIQGRGAYLAQVTVVPANVSVAWGHKFSMKASIPSVTNAGSSRHPVAAAQVQVGWKVETVLTHSEEVANYYVRGDGAFVSLNDRN